MAGELIDSFETSPSERRIHVVGAGPVGLMLTALLQSMEGLSVHLYEKRREYTRTRMVRLASYLVADSVESYRNDHIDGETVEAVFDPPELDESLAFRRSIPPDLMTLLQEWSQGFCPLNSIERAISDLIDTRGTSNVQRTAAVVTFDDAIAMLEPGDIADRLHGLLVAAAKPPGARPGRGWRCEHAQHQARVRPRDHVSLRSVI